MDKVYSAIDRLISYARANLLLAPKNQDYVRNKIFNMFGLENYEGSGAAEPVPESTPENLIKEFCAACIEEGLFCEEDAERYSDAVMDALTLPPDGVEKIFNDKKDGEGAEAATEWFYDYSVKSDYVKKAKLDLNPRFEEDGLIITINKAKPEFRDAKKAAAGNKPKGGYPKCNICHENEGFAGRAKCTLRTIDITLGGEKWFWQFSPYGYFYQHGIAVNYTHTPMHVDRGAIVRLLDFIDLFPHYFIGSNAALPRIGGSVLAHDHYQGGGEILPLQKAAAYKTFNCKGYKDAVLEILDWPGTAVRAVSHNRDAIIGVSAAINDCWKDYDNPALGLICRGEDGQRHAVSPTVIKTKRGYEMNIILRSNITSNEYPDGVFHAHPEFHVIKKESIGLIEAQGLFILPGRLERELGEMGDLIVKGQELTDELKDFGMVFEETKALCGGDFSERNVRAAVKKELASVCRRILENTAVFKDKADTEKFILKAGVIDG